MEVDVKAMQVEKALEEADQMLEKKNLIGFIESISKARFCAEEAVNFLPMIAFAKARGLFLLREYEIALDAITEALKCNQGVEKIRLQKYKGLILGYYGRFDEALRVLRELLTEIVDLRLLAEVRINISWLCLAHYRVEENSQLLEEAKIYLDLVKQNLEQLDDHFKWQMYLNYGEYYIKKNQNTEAIQMLEKAMTFCHDKILPKVYNTLAELHLVEENYEVMRDYLHKAEVLAYKDGNDFEIAKALFTQGLAEIHLDEELKALDAFFLSFEHFKNAKAYIYAFNCFTKILEVSHGLKISCLDSLKQGIRKSFKNTAFYEQLGGVEK